MAADTLTAAQRSWTMARVRSTNTKPELMIRSLLHRMGYRFRANLANLPGKPDIVLPKFRTVVFVHGCFWHRHPGCRHASTPSARREYWTAKFDRNAERDKRNKRLLHTLGWTVIVVWECQVLKDPAGVAERIAQCFDPHFCGIPCVAKSPRELLKAAEKRSKYLVRCSAK